MKILQVITKSELGGAQTVVVNLANKLSEEHDVVVVVGEGDGKMLEMLNKDITIEHCEHLQRAIHPIKDLKAGWALRKLYKKHKPDIIHLHSSKAGTLGRVVFPTKKCVYTVHGFDSVRVAFRKFLPIERMLQHFCKAIVAVSKYDEINLLAEKIKNNVSTVYNGIKQPNTSDLQNIPALNSSNKVILCIARVFPPKKTDLFIEIARLLPQYSFVWIGNQREVTEFGELPKNCHFVGNIANAGAYCSLADMFILPSNYEGLPMVILEAMCFGKPIIASNVGGINEIVRDGVNGYALKNDKELFAEKIDYILTHPDICRAFGEKSKEIFETELTVDKMVNGYLEIYNKVLANE